MEGHRMPTRPPERVRLAELMDERRSELGMTWEQVAEVGGTSYETIRAARNDDSGIRRLTQAAIERALQWESGSVARILGGGEPGASPDPSRPARSASRVPFAPDPDDDEAATFFPDDLTLRRLWRLDEPREVRLALVEQIRRLRRETLEAGSESLRRGTA